ncbi:hypothetical protein KAR91_76595 [Candidatus Pacearchaeota archaeon]|nr:hypothetical protein [Candidatus Pacearchaeota archaeon]
MAKKKEMKDMSDKSTKGYYKGSAIMHIIAVVGMYLLTWGLIGSASLGDVLTSPIFWGLLLLGSANCCKAHKMNGACKI